MNELYTIGYSPHSLESFIALLNHHGINAIADVRSIPFSKFKPDFNKETLSNFLKDNNMVYVFLGDQCGARFDDPACYKNGKVDYNIISKHQKFQDGLNRIREGVKKYKVALMCAEKDPIYCHRMILICRNLKNDRIKIQHILNIDKVEDQFASELRLLKLFKLEQPDIFKSEQERIELAYNKQSEKIAFNDDRGSNSETHCCPVNFYL